MKAVITGASSGIGKDIALYLDSLGYEIFLVGRNKDKLQEVANNCRNIKAIFDYDLSIKDNLFKLYDKLKGENVDLFVNNAGFGMFGYFDETDLDKELEMIDVNVRAVHVLTKLFLKDMVKNNKGKILNVASSAGFFAGPYLNTYYATKNYVLKLTMAINEELRYKKSNVSISCLCPGPVDTNFNNVAGGSFKSSSLTSPYVAKYGIDNTLKGKMIIIPGISMKISVFFSRFLPYRLQLKLLHYIQRGKGGKIC